MPSTQQQDDAEQIRKRSSSGNVGPLAIALGITTGGLNLAVILVLYRQYGYPLPDGVALVGFAATLFVLGFIPGFVSGHTRLVVPIVGFLVLLTGVATAEVTTPAPEWDTLGEYTVVVGDLYVSRWANDLQIWVALLLAGGVAEFALRDGYGLGAERLRNLPTVPLSGYVVAWLAGGFGALFGATITVHTVRIGVSPTGIEFVIFLAATLAVAVPLAAVLTRGLVAPIVLFGLVVPRPLLTEVFETPDSPLFLLLLGPIAVVFALVAAIEYLVRYQWRTGDDGNRFATDSSP